MQPRPAHLGYRPCRHTIGRLHTELLARGSHVTVPAQVLDSAHPDKNVPAIHEFSDSLPQAALIVIPRGLDDVPEVVASGAVVIGSRMHACLNMHSPLAPRRFPWPAHANLTHFFVAWGGTTPLTCGTQPLMRWLPCCNASQVGIWQQLLPMW